MPLVLRMAAYLLEASDDNSRSTAEREVLVGAQECVPLWISHCITPRTTAKDVIVYLLSVIEGRMKATLFITDSPRRQRKASVSRSKSPRKDSAGKSKSSPPAKSVDWSLCLQDADGKFHFCGDTRHYAKSRLIHVPFLTEVAAKSNAAFEEMRREVEHLREEGSVAGTSPLADSGAGTSGSSMFSVLASTSAALQFADDRSMKFAFARSAVVPSAMLKKWNPQYKQKLRLYDAVTLPSDLQDDPVAATASPPPAAAADAADAVSRREKRVTIEDSPTNPVGAQLNLPPTLGREEGSARADPVASSSRMNLSGKEGGPPRAHGSDAVTLQQPVTEVPHRPPALPLHEAQSPEGATDALTEPFASTREAASSIGHTDAPRVCQLATHATSLAAVGSLDPVLAVTTSELRSVWRRHGLRLDGVDEAERQRMIHEEDTARLRLAKSHLLYDDAVSRHAAAVAGGGGASAGGVADDDAETKALLQQKAELKEEIQANAKAERECEKLVLLVEFYEKEIADAAERARMLREVLA